ncbi:lytic murein transglycosylase [Bordetella bronchiseptica]|uniref:lytic murein transglycosylase n=1 Tax=Bordetella bronchiseptica TaxID=518 RepID=UPI00028A82E1|nr:lytic murein transglycosylase [Bordetella bronchiseptica]AUL16516.1 lytic transglycosylase [Bordetella bronchiseptica]AWP59743.1 lytic transglycosylase [Bordetella bronchiseptica]KAK72711.1 lytic murein transglycosylase [Bordetella bronchiseptica CA90 BB02]KAK74721.1 lytic murein transglycosylase [Bordetella bronchiseptica MO211]KDC19034.1 lytic murein transglycosylase [Bordetella bronchiseptica F-1]
MVHMNKAYLRLLCATAFAAAAIPALAAPAAATPADLDAYRACLKQLRGDAIKSGVQAATYDAQTASLAPDMDVLGFLDAQPEFKTPIWDYMAGLVDEERIEDGRQALARHADVLARAQAEYGVDPATVVAVWGVESNFGKNLGGRPLLTSLSTLSCFGRRQSYFRGEFFATLKIIQDEHMQPERLAGSWAGAFGQTQFMPSTYLRLAVDFDGDGRRDLVDSVPDALGSTANFLRRAGWQTGQPWGFEVKLPAGMDLAGTGRRNKQPMSAWQARGIKRVDGGALPAGDTPAALLAPAGAQGPVFLVLRNFDALYSYNAAESYALAIAHLSDRLRGDLPFARAWPTDDPGLSRAERRELQELLLARGFDIGKPDGVIGARTRQALQTVQGQLGLPADGRAGQKTLKALRTP